MPHDASRKILQAVVEQTERMNRQFKEAFASSALNEMLASLTRHQERLEKAFRSSRTMEAFGRQQDQLNAYLQNLFDTDAFHRFGELLKEARPPNWPDGDDQRLITLIERTRWPLVWIPEESVVQEMLHCTDDEALDLVVLNRAQDILANCSARIDEIPPEKFSVQVEGARQAIAAFAVAPMAAQALAAATFESVLHRTLGYPKLRDAADDLASATNWRDSPFRFFRWALIRSCMPNVLNEYWPHRNDPIPTQFNRHASVHALGPEQYRITNAVVGVMLIVAALRELHQLQEDHLI